jgi:hypothetical protein
MPRTRTVLMPFPTNSNSLVCPTMCFMVAVLVGPAVVALMGNRPVAWRRIIWTQNYLLTALQLREGGAATVQKKKKKMGALTTVLTNTSDGHV